MLDIKVGLTKLFTLIETGFYSESGEMVMRVFSRRRLFVNPDLLLSAFAFLKGLIRRGLKIKSILLVDSFTSLVVDAK